MLKKRLKKRLTVRTLRILMMLLVVGAAIAAFTVISDKTPPFGFGTVSEEASQPRAELSLAPEYLIDFGDVAVGERKESRMIATNRGSAPLVLSAIEASADFSAAPPTLELAPGESRALTIYFQPQQTSAHHQGQLRMLADDPAIGEQVVELRGRAHALASIHIEPMALSFGEVSLRGVGRAALHIENRGEEDLHISAMWAPQPFTVVSAVETLAPGEGADVEVRFLPEEMGRFEEDMLVRSTDSSSQAISVNLKGTGVFEHPEARIRLGSEAVEFGKVRVGGSATRYVAIKNTGSDPLNITRVAVAKPFTGPDRGWRIEPNATYRMGFRFSPEAAGETSAPVTIYSNDPDQGDIEIDLVGVGAFGGATGSNGSETVYAGARPAPTRSAAAPRAPLVTKRGTRKKGRKQARHPPSCAIAVRTRAGATTTMPSRMPARRPSLPMTRISSRPSRLSARAAASALPPSVRRFRTTTRTVCGSTGRAECSTSITWCCRP